MLRFIVKKIVFDAYSHGRFESLQTVDIDVKILESILSDIGYGDSGSTSVDLIGVEIINKQ